MSLPVSQQGISRLWKHEPRLVVRRVSEKTAFDIELPRTVFECGLFCTRNGLWLILGMDYHIADSPPVVKHYLVA